MAGHQGRWSVVNGEEGSPRSTALIYRGVPALTQGRRGGDIL